MIAALLLREAVMLREISRTPTLLSLDGRRFRRIAKGRLVFWHSSVKPAGTVESFPSIVIRALGIGAGNVGSSTGVS
jgi:hypothetical protein